ncbi:MAG: class I SAM-dependent methyltransferase [Opitutales bacterium]
MPSRDPWSASTLARRIASGGLKQRHAAGSPGPEEVEAYARGLPEGLAEGSALVLGMTPELRNLAASRAAQTVAIDRNAEAVALYRDWLDPRYADRERIVESGWFELATQVIPEAPFHAILGDGIFANTPDRAAHLDLLQLFKAVLAPGGRMIFRKALAWEGQPSQDAAWLIEQYRAGAIDAAAFGLGMRLTGFLNAHYDRATSMLDNAALFAAIAELADTGGLTEAEFAATQRYYFDGNNCLLTRPDWEAVLREAGMQFRVHPLEGRLWYAYYPVYEVWPAR